MDRARDIGALRRALASLGSEAQTDQHGLISLGAVPVDEALGGGLARGAVHEIFAPQTADFPAAAGFATGLFLRQSERNQGPLIWVREAEAQKKTGMLYGHGLAEMGIAAGETILVTVADFAQGLRAGFEVLKCHGVAMLVLELWGHSRLLDLSASRRLALAAARSGVMGLMLRVAAQPAASSVSTRWAITAHPSADSLGLPGRAAFSALLLRQRGGRPLGHWNLEWDNDNHRFSVPALPRPLSAPAFDRSAGADRRTVRARAR